MKNEIEKTTTPEKEKNTRHLLSPKRPYLWIGIGVLVVAVTILLCLLCIPSDAEVSSALDECIVSTIRLAHLSDHTAGKYPAVAYTTLGTKQSGNSVTVYGVMMYREYTCTTEDELTLWGAAISPFAITADMQEDGSYEATACWWPEDGKNYASSIRAKFPLYCSQAAINAQNYFAELDAACRADVTKMLSAEEKYVVLISERDNVQVAYCPSNTSAYIEISNNSVIVDGSYAVDDTAMTFTFNGVTVVFTIDDTECVYDEEKSKDVPALWKTDADGGQYLADGTRFAPVARGDSASVGKTLIVHSTNWTTLDEIQEMFGYVPGDFTFEKSYYLPIKVLKSRAELDWLLASHMEDTQWTDLKQENFTAFDEAFFENHSLVMVYYNAPYASYEPKVSAYKYTEDGTCLSVRLDVYQPAVGDTVVGQWLLFSGIKKSDMEGVKVLEAYVENVSSDTTPTDGALSFTGTVKQVDGHAMLMETDDVAQFNSGVWVELGDIELDPMVGETYTVTYEDIVMPSLPPRITAVTITKP